MKQNPPIRLLLMRHGNTFETGQTPYQVGAQTDLALTAAGRAQAGAFARYLTSKKIDPKAIYAGSLKRQTESAAIIAASLSAENRTHLNESALMELDYGLWEGLDSQEILARWPKEFDDWTKQSIWPKAIFRGTFEEKLEAVEKWVQKMEKLYAPGDTVVGVTSNGTLRFFAFLEGERWNQLRMGLEMEKIKVKTGHFCDLLIYKDRLKIAAWDLEPFKEPSEIP